MTFIMKYTLSYEYSFKASGAAVSSAWTPLCDEVPQDKLFLDWMSTALRVPFASRASPDQTVWIIARTKE